MPALEVTDLRKAFGQVKALDGVGLVVGEGEFLCIVGPTNAGKSTLLKCVAGLVRPDQGSIRIQGVDVRAHQPRYRGVSLLFQNIALFPNLTGFENIAFPLRSAGVPEAVIVTRVREIADVLDVGHILDRLPRTFSGGEQQRIAIGRAIVQPVDLLLLDEPLTNLDARIRIALRLMLERMHAETGQSLIYVTHDQVEAMSLSNRIAVLNRGRLEQVGTPDEIYHRPATRFVAEFIGSPPMNIFDLHLDPDAPGLVAGENGLRLPQALIGQLGHRVTVDPLALGVRPEAVRVAPERSAATPIPADVLWVEHLGARSILDARIGRHSFKVVVPADHPVRSEGSAWFGFDLDRRLLLDRTSGRFLR